MNQYLLQILKETNTIIIPGLGALTLTNEKTGEIMFLSYLNYDDGKLIAYISEKDGLELNDAKNSVAKYVREIQSKLDKGESYDMFQFGSFFKNNDGEVDFKQWNDSVDSETNVKEAEEKKTEDAEITNVEEVKTETKIETVIPEETIEEIAPVKTIDEILAKPVVPIEEVLEEKKVISEIEVPKPVEKPIEKVKAVSTPSNSSDEIKENIYISPEELKNQEIEEKTREAKKEEAKAQETSKVKNIPSEENVKKKRGTGFFIGIILIVLISLSAIGTAIFYQQIKSLIPFLNKDKQEIQLEEKVVVDEVEDSLDEIYKDTLDLNNKTESEPEKSLQPEKIEKTEGKISVKPTPVQQNGSYHVIAGSFSTEANALRFVEELKAKNTASEYIGKYGMYLVSYGGFASNQEAIKAMKAAGHIGWIKKI